MKRLALIFSLFAVLTFAQVRSVTMYTAYDLASACPTFVYDDGGGTAAEDGWVTVSNEPNRSIQIDIVALTATDAQFIIEGRNSGLATGARIWPSLTGTTTILGTEDPISLMVPVPDPVNQVRLGMCITTDTAGAEDIDVVLNTFAPDKR
ncbi:MAG: hypothetical protein GY896_22995 [Gammaproteobacteria bacterium]|nr:hypothetical protein [Gammaproteobacteria bacterium]